MAFQIISHVQINEVTKYAENIDMESLLEGKNHHIAIK